MSDKQIVLAVDIDDVLFDFIGYFFDWHNQRYGTALTPSDMMEGKLWEVWGGTKAQAAERVPAFFQETDHLGMAPIPGAQACLQKLSEAYRLFVVSARDPATSKITHAWIDKYFPGLFHQTSLGIANPMSDQNSMSKAEMCRQLGAQVLIEDQLVNAEVCAREGIRVLLFGNYSWNQADILPRGIQRVENWDQICSLL